MKYFIYVYIYLLLATPAYAYLDPGMGSIILTAIAAMFAAIVTTFKLWWYKLKSFLALLRNKKKINKEKGYLDNST